MITVYYNNQKRAFQSSLEAINFININEIRNFKIQGIKIREFKQYISTFN